MPRMWDPSPEDAISLAAFRWLANAIENASIELYATDRESFKEVEGILRHTLKDLGRMRRSFVSEDEKGCPDGYVLCHGICAPACEFEAAMATVPAGEKKAPARRKPKR